MKNKNSMGERKALSPILLRAFIGADGYVYQIHDE
jgi:hypothetical protein